MNITYQKYSILGIVASINALLSTTFIIYSENWYAFTIFLALASFVSSYNAILNFGVKIKQFISNSCNKKYDYRIDYRNYIYVIPCYNESEDELRLSINSLTNQKSSLEDNKSLFVICDGKVYGDGNNQSTDNILKKILNVDEKTSKYYEYDTWDGKKNKVQIYTGMYLDIINYTLCIKEKNYGKRDSLVLVRKLCYNYNFKIFDELENNFEKDIYLYFQDIYITKLNYIIGIDADTIFDYNCTDELIKAIDSDKNIYGCVGYVDISPKMNRWSPFILYQYAEYMFAQCLKRFTQSNITQKVNCLSGCNQILRVSEETCGPKILNAFNKLPDENESIFNHIRSYASEDRNHVILMLSMYPYVKTIQKLTAVCYTNVPTSIRVFASQRRRWNLGANSNDLLLVYLPGIKLFERIAAFVNVSTFILTPFIFIATAFFIKSIIMSANMLMLYLSIIMIIPFIYGLLIPIFIRPLSFKNTLYYYISLIFFIIVGIFVNLLTYTYALLNMDTIKWGKTRLVDKNNQNKNDEKISIDSKEINIDDLIKNADQQMLEKSLNKSFNKSFNKSSIIKVDNQNNNLSYDLDKISNSSDSLNSINIEFTELYNLINQNQQQIQNQINDLHQHILYKSEKRKQKKTMELENRKKQQMNHIIKINQVNEKVVNILEILEQTKQNLQNEEKFDGFNNININDCVNDGVNDGDPIEPIENIENIEKIENIENIENIDGFNNIINVDDILKIEVKDDQDDLKDDLKDDVNEVNKLDHESYV